jgi:hypothetical protein
VITWFDALLVTVWAVVTALGARRGLSGLAWGLGGVAACLLANLLGRTVSGGGTLLAVPLAALLGAGLALVIRRQVPLPLERPWHMAAGALGGFALGGVLLATLTLGLPIEVRVGAQGRTGVYPSTNLPTPLYAAVDDSLLKDSLMGVWNSGPALRTLLVPDQR